MSSADADSETESPRKENRPSSNHWLARAARRTRRHLRRYPYLYLTLGLLALPVVAAWRSGVLVSENDDCEVRDVLQFLALGESPQPFDATCQTVPLAADWPSVLIGISCACSVLLYGRYRRLLISLNNDLAEAGLMSRRQADRLMDLEAGPEWWRTVAPFFNVCVVAILLSVGFRFHAFVQAGSPWFDFLTQAGDDNQAASAALRSGWWANSTEHPANAFTWGLVGVVGSYFAVQHTVLHARLTWKLRQKSSKPKVVYVERWKEPDHGWVAFERVLLVICFGILNFGIGFFAVAYILLAGRAGDSLLAVTLLATGFGTWINYIVLGSIYRFIRDGFRDARRRRAKKVHEAHVEGRTSAEVLVAQLNDLSVTREFPITGFWRYSPILATAFIGQASLLVALFKWGLST